jgi:hypothetical protein
MTPVAEPIMPTMPRAAGGKVMALNAVRFISVLLTFAEMCRNRINSLPRQQ